MRIWVGKEQEGRYKGIYTMFVESDKINMCTLRIIIDTLKEYPTISALYFGAGRKNVRIISKDCIDMLEELRKKYILSIEFDKYGTDVPNLFRFDNNIFRMMCEPLNYNNVSIKIDTNKDVFSQSIECMFKTNLKELNDFRFIGTDKLVYENIKGED